jgi:hypothetical protein
MLNILKPKSLLRMKKSRKAGFEENRIFHQIRRTENVNEVHMEIEGARENNPALLSENLQTVLRNFLVCEIF